MASVAANVVPFPTASSRWDYRNGTPNRVFGLPDGDPGTAKTIAFMRGLASGSEGAQNPTVRRHALSVVQGLEPRDKQGQIAAIFDWVKSKIEFRGEYQELLQSPLTTLQLLAGDCDDHSMLLAALLKTLGFDTRFSTVASDAEDPKQFTHVFCEVLDPTTGQWRPIDTTVKDSFPGWRPPNVYRERNWPVMGFIGQGSEDFLAPVGGSSDASLQSEIFTTIQPLSQALANKIQGTSPIDLNLGLGNPFSPTTGAPSIAGVPWWGFGLIIVAFVWALRSGKRR